MQKLGVSQKLFAISLLSLFCEMLVIRWLSTEIRIFAYFKNLPLMAAFLGLGLGFLWTKKPTDFLKWSSIGILYFGGLMILAVGLHLTHLIFVDPTQIMLFGDYVSGKLPLSGFLASLVTVIGVFTLSTFIFVGFGQKTGQLFEELPPLKAYSINIAGALAGIGLFALLSNMQTDPGVWLVVTGMLFLLFSRRPASVLIIVLGLAYTFWLAPVMARLLYSDSYVTTVWSPYYRIDVLKAHLPLKEHPNDPPIPLGYDIFINYDSFQSMLDCQPETLAKLPAHMQTKVLERYAKPFNAYGKTPENVLIMGAGTGSDVAAALRCGAKHVDAVEIDKSIYELGKRYHPDHPYDSNKVSVHIQDARTFLKHSKDKFDVIVFALLDSHTAFSSLSSLRTDNFVFTVQSFRDALRLLKPGGIITVDFIVVPDWLWDRHCKDLYLATGKLPTGSYWVDSLPTAFLVAHDSRSNDLTTGSKPPTSWALPRKTEFNNQIMAITDDWPFLFLPRHEIPFVYILPMLLVMLVSMIPVGRLLTEGKSTVVDWQLFLLGMGFMLLETRAMSAVSLLCGATWTVNSVVIAGVMVMILVANAIALRLSNKHLNILLGCVAITIVTSSMVDVGELNSLEPWLATTIGTTVFLLPLMFSATIFATIFKQTTLSSRSLAFNIIGGLFGVSVEYLSMAFGIKALSWFALAIYFGVFALALKKDKTPVVVPERAN
jgi:SAM-dependent methyltransferase